MKPIRLTEKEINKIREDFEQVLAKTRLTDGSLSFVRGFGNKKAKDEERAKIYYTSDAYLKMLLLVARNTGEVGWHGLVKKIADRSWLVYDVIVYDQEVTGSTVNTNDEGYLKFLIDLPEEKNNNMFFHGHSHVNMGVTPSGVDMEHRDKLVNALKDDGFYIFQIWNKSLNVSTAIYDLADNILYDTDDVDVSILFDDETTSVEFNEAADKCIHQKKYPAPVYPLPSAETKKYEKAAAENWEKQKKKSGTYKTYPHYNDADDYDQIYDGMKPYGYYDGYPY